MRRDICVFEMGWNIQILLWVKRTMSTYILGISAFYHDSAASLICDGHIIAAAQEERFTRKKFDARFPTNAIQYCEYLSFAPTMSASSVNRTLPPIADCEDV